MFTEQRLFSFMNEVLRNDECICCFFSLGGSDSPAHLPSRHVFLRGRLRWCRRKSPWVRPTRSRRRGQRRDHREPRHPPDEFTVLAFSGRKPHDGLHGLRRPAGSPKALHGRSWASQVGAFSQRKEELTFIGWQKNKLTHYELFVLFSWRLHLSIRLPRPPCWFRACFVLPVEISSAQ